MHVLEDPGGGAHNAAACCPLILLTCALLATASLPKAGGATAPQGLRFALHYTPPTESQEQQATPGEGEGAHTHNRGDNSPLPTPSPPPSVTTQQPWTEATAMGGPASVPVIGHSDWMEGWDLDGNDTTVVNTTDPRYPPTHPISNNCSSGSRPTYCLCARACLHRGSKCLGWSLRPPPATAVGAAVKSEGAPGALPAPSALRAVLLAEPPVLNNTDLGAPSIANFNLRKGTTLAQGIAACRAYCTAHNASCGGWVFVTDKFDPGSRWNGPRCSIKGNGPCTPVPRAQCYSSMIAGHCEPQPPRPPHPPPPPPPPHPPPPPKPPPPPVPPAPPLTGPTCHLKNSMAGVRAVKAPGVVSGVANGFSTQTLRIAQHETTATLRVFVDASFAEAYWQNGRVAMTIGAWPLDVANLKVAAAAIFSTAPVNVVSATAWAVKSIWVSPEDVVSTARMDAE